MMGMIKRRKSYNIISLIISIATMVLPVNGFAGEDETIDNVPSTAHMVTIRLRDGKLYQASEYFFDRVSMQCRIDFYEFEEEPLDIKENQYQDMSGWEILKAKLTPHCIDVYSIEERYQVCFTERDFTNNSGYEGNLSQTDFPPKCIVSTLPYEPAAENHAWNAFFAPKSLNACKMVAGLPDKPLPDEKTGEYVYNKGLYVEHFLGRVSRPPVGPDYIFDKTWYEPKYLLPCRSMAFGVRQDDSRYLFATSLSEYDHILDEGVFDPEHICDSREGFSILKQDLKKYPQTLEKDVAPPAE